MISRHSRRNVRPVEPLNQFPITAAKGVDGTKNADSLDTVQDLQNFDITVSGDAELRKPMVLQKDYGSVLYTKVLYDNTSRLIVSQDNTVTIVNSSGTAQPIRFVWFDYHTLQEYSSRVIPNASFIAWANAQFANTNTATVVTNVEVDLNASYLKVNGETVIYDPKLYDDSTIQLRFRTLQIYWSDEDQVWTIKINSPEVNVLSASDTISLDANMALDNPYAVRDEYESSAPSVKGVLPYVTTRVSDTGDVIVDPSSAVSDTLSLESTVANTTGVVPGDLSDSISSWVITPHPSTVSYLAEGVKNYTYGAYVTVNLDSTNQPISKRVFDGWMKNNSGNLPTVAKDIPVWTMGRNGTSVPVADLYTLDLKLQSIDNVVFDANGNLTSIRYYATILRAYFGTYVYYDASPQDASPWCYYCEPPRLPSNVVEFTTKLDAHLPPSNKMCTTLLSKLLNATKGSTGSWTNTDKNMTGRIARCVGTEYGTDLAYRDYGSGYEDPLPVQAEMSKPLFYAGRTGASGNFRFYLIGFPANWSASDIHTQTYGYSDGSASLNADNRIWLKIRGSETDLSALGSASWGANPQVTTSPPASESPYTLSEEYF